MTAARKSNRRKAGRGSVRFTVPLPAALKMAVSVPANVAPKVPGAAWMDAVAVSVQLALPDVPHEPRFGPFQTALPEKTSAL